MDDSTTNKINAQETENNLTAQDDGVSNRLATHKTRSPSASCNGLTSNTFKTAKRHRAYASPSNKRNTSALGGSSSSSQSEYFGCASDVSSCDDKDRKSGKFSIVNDGTLPTTATVKQENSIISSSNSRSKFDPVASINMSSKRNCDKRHDSSSSFESSREHEKFITVSEKVRKEEALCLLLLRISLNKGNAFASDRG